MESFGFILKKLLSALCYPVGFSLALLVTGILLSRGWRSAGGHCVIAGTAVLAVCSFPPLGLALLSGLENSAGGYCDPARLNDAGTKAVVVLGSELVVGQGPPAELLRESLGRVLEGVRLWKGLPGARLIISGGATPFLSSRADVIIEVCLAAGVDRDALIVETNAWDTEDEARILGERVEGAPFALVTAAMHLKRSKALFARYGHDPFPCPCEFRTRKPLSSHDWVIPGPHSLMRAQTAIHEYLGLAWLRFKMMALP